MRKPLMRRLKGAAAWHGGRLLRAVADRAATRWHDLTARPRHTPGALPAAPRVAIYLIHPQTGLLPSHRRTLAAVAAAGYAPLVVSNLSLSDADRTAAAALAWAVIERPNFGYDFGGYRAGVLALGGRLGGLARLALLNDSVWYPLPGGLDFLAAAEALGADLVGAVSNLGVAMPAPDGWRGMRWRHDPSRPDFHYCSFALSFGPRVLGDPGFARFWRRLPLSDAKLDTVRRGEVGLTQWLLRRGASHAATFDVAHLDRDLAALPDDALRETLAGLVIPEDGALRAIRRAVLARADGRAGWRDEALAFILAAVALTGPAYALPGYALARARHPFLKKSPLRLDPEGAAVTLDLAARLPGAAGAEILAEARALAATAPRTPPAPAAPAG